MEKIATFIVETVENVIYSRTLCIPFRRRTSSRYHSMEGLDFRNGTIRIRLIAYIRSNYTEAFEFIPTTQRMHSHDWAN